MKKKDASSSALNAEVLDTIKIGITGHRNISRDNLNEILPNFCEQ